MPDDERNYAEIVELRRRLLTIDVAVAHLSWRSDSGEKAQERTAELLSQLSREFEALMKTDEIADAVAERMTEARTLRLTHLQKLLVTVVTVVGLAGSLKSLAGL